MAAGSLLALLDDIATMLDDVSVMTTMAAKKTAGVLGDDLALNAQQISGVDASRELPVVWKVAKGSFINKLILVPVALFLNYISSPDVLNIPWLVTSLLMIGGAYLCFEGFEKLAHKFLQSSKDEEHHVEAIKQAIADPKVDLVALEKEKIKGAIRTDFILSAEIIVIALGVLKETPVTNTFIPAEYMLATALSAVAIGLTIAVYGLVAGIVKIDDVGLHLMLQKGSSAYKQLLRKIGSLLLAFAPKLMRTLTILGTAAMFLVGGSIIGHGIPALHHLSEHIVQLAHNIPTIGGALAAIAPLLVDAIIGLTVGAICVLAYTVISKFLPKTQH